MTAREKHLRKAGARLVRTGGWDDSRIAAHIRDEWPLSEQEAAWVLAGAAAERARNPDGKPGRPLL